MQSKCSIWPASFVDHTSGNGNFLIIDGNDTYAPQDLWLEHVVVYPNITYTFSFWAKNLYTQQPFNLEFNIGGMPIATTPYITAGVWNQYSTTWTSTYPYSVLVSIAIKQITAGAYRDLGIDDIFMGYCDTSTEIEQKKEPDPILKIFPNPASNEITIN